MYIYAYIFKIYTQQIYTHLAQLSYKYHIGEIATNWRLYGSHGNPAVVCLLVNCLLNFIFLNNINNFKAESIVVEIANDYCSDC